MGRRKEGRKGGRKQRQKRKKETHQNNEEMPRLFFTNARRRAECHAKGPMGLRKEGRKVRKEGRRAEGKKKRTSARTKEIKKERMNDVRTPSPYGARVNELAVQRQHAQMDERREVIQVHSFRM